MPPYKIEARAYIFLNGDFEKPKFDWPPQPSEADLVIAADGGLKHVLKLGWAAHCLVGDMDSVEKNKLDELKSLEIIHHPEEKNETDFELALILARKKGYTNIEVVGALGGRWDMSFANILFPGFASWSGENLRFRQGAWTFWTLTGPGTLTIDGKQGDLLSLLPLGENVRGISLSNCRYPLTSETLKPGRSRGLSNEMLADSCRVEFHSGYLLLIHCRQS